MRTGRLEAPVLIERSGIPPYQGATAAAAGLTGAVPPAPAGQQGSALLGSGAWGTVTSTATGGAIVQRDASSGFSAGTITSPRVTTASGELALTMSGDAFGSCLMALRNRNGSAGAIFQNQSLDLIDLGFQASSGAQQNFRFEKRSLYVANGNSGSGEFQFLAFPLTPPYGQNFFWAGPAQVGTTAPFKLASFTAATLPIAGTAGRVVYCSDARWSGGVGCLVTDAGSYWATPDGCQASAAAQAFVGTFTGSASLTRIHETCFYDSATAGTFTLPATASHFGKLFNLKQVGTGTLSTAGGTVEGQSSISLVQNQSVTIVCDATQWRIV